MTKKNTCVSLYASEQTAEQAVEELLSQNFDLKTVSMVGKAFHNEEDTIGLYTSGGQLCFSGVQAAFWNSLWGQLSGASFFWLPDFGPLVAAGTIGSLLVKEQEDIEVGSGLNVLGAALFSLGIPRDSIRQYEKALKEEKFLLIVHAVRSDVEHACHILHSETQQVAVHMA